MTRDGESQCWYHAVHLLSYGRLVQHQRLNRPRSRQSCRRCCAERQCPGHRQPCMRQSFPPCRWLFAYLLRSTPPSPSAPRSSNQKEPTTRPDCSVLPPSTSSAHHASSPNTRAPIQPTRTSPSSEATRALPSSHFSRSPAIRFRARTSRPTSTVFSSWLSQSPEVGFRLVPPDMEKMLAQISQDKAVL